MKHTKEPWMVDLRGGCCAIYAKDREHDKNGIGKDDDRNIAYSNKSSFFADEGFWKMDEKTQIDFKRIVACVNACAGITNEALEAGIIPYTIDQAHRWNQLDQRWEKRNNEDQEPLTFDGFKIWEEV